ncbi:MAG: chemotaxis-specific protein-glutamate methyltransferase CheB [candidate division WOR-3 bacterium]
MSKKILVVDDSALMRKLLRDLFEARGYEVMTARNGVEAVELNNTFEPDLITLDINMPEMDGLTALSHIMIQRPVPVIMVSSLTEDGALATFEALNLGAVDYVTKPGGTISLNIDKISDELINKVEASLKARLRRGQLIKQIRKEREKIIKPKTETLSAQDEGVVLIGVSTGGPRTLEEILPELPEDFPNPVVVAQHMPATFTECFAERLNNICKLNVIEVNRPLPLERGNIYIGKGETDVVITRRLDKLIVQPKPENPRYLWHPSVEVLGRSALESIEPSRIIAVMLTGMGYDGADAFAEIKRKGGRTIAESEETAVIFGMPRELIERDGATVILPSNEIAKQLIKWARRN